MRSSDYRAQTRFVVKALEQASRYELHPGQLTITALDGSQLLFQQLVQSTPEASTKSKTSRY